MTVSKGAAEYRKRLYASIMEDHSAGLTVKQIAQKYHRDISGIRWIIKRHAQSGEVAYTPEQDIRKYGVAMDEAHSG